MSVVRRLGRRREGRRGSRGAPGRAAIRRPAAAASGSTRRDVGEPESARRPRRPVARRQADRRRSLPRRRRCSRSRPVLPGAFGDQQAADLAKPCGQRLARGQYSELLEPAARDALRAARPRPPHRVPRPVRRPAIRAAPRRSSGGGSISATTTAATTLWRPGSRSSARSPRRSGSGQSSVSRAKSAAQRAHPRRHARGAEMQDEFGRQVSTRSRGLCGTRDIDDAGQQVGVGGEQRVAARHLGRGWCRAGSRATRATAATSLSGPPSACRPRTCTRREPSGPASSSSSPTRIVPAPSVAVTTVPAPPMVNARSTHSRTGPVVTGGGQARPTSRRSAARNSGSPSPVRPETATASSGPDAERGAAQPFEHVLAHRLGVGEIAARHGDEPVLHTERVERGDVLAGLRLPAAVGRHHEQRRGHRPDARRAWCAGTGDGPARRRRRAVLAAGRRVVQA